MMGSFGLIGVASILWIIVGYTISFGLDIGGVIGNLKWLGLGGVDMAPSDYAGTIPQIVFVAFQMMFSVITPALITGALVERMKFTHQMVFTVLWSLLIYYPVAHGLG